MSTDDLTTELARELRVLRLCPADRGDATERAEETRERASATKSETARRDHLAAARWFALTAAQASARNDDNAANEAAGRSMRCSVGR
jgi:hypothetical protein